MNYSSMTLVQLKALARARGLSGISTLKKSELIGRLMQIDDEKEEAEQKLSVREESEQAAPEKEEILNKAPDREENGQKTADREASAQRSAEKDSATQRIPRKETLGQRTPVREAREESGQRMPRKEETGQRNYGKDPSEQRAQRREETDLKNQKNDLSSLDSGVKADGILEVMPDGFGFIRCANYLPGENDVYVSPSQIRKFNLKTGDILVGNIRVKTQNEKYSALLYVESVNGFKPYDAQKRKNFEDLTPIFPDKRIRLEQPGAPVSMRLVDMLSPIGKGQRGMIVSQPKTGKTTLLKQIAKSITQSQPNMKLIVLLIDERPEEVTDIREYIEGPNAEVIYSTFDELPEHHKRVSEMVLERAKRLVEHKQDVVILLDSITRLARAYNLVVPPSGRTLSGGLDPAALHMPKKFFGAARNMREGGSLTILATALVDTGSKMDDMVFEEFKGTGNMELVLDRKLSEKRIFPAINIQKSGTRRDDLLLTKEEQEVVYYLHREMSGSRAEENIEEILKYFKNTKNNKEFIGIMQQSMQHQRS